MNYSMPAPQPITDLARMLGSPQGDRSLDKLLRILNDEELKVAQLLNRGLDKNDYARASRRVHALQHAQAVLKSLHMFLKP